MKLKGATDWAQCKISWFHVRITVVSYKENGVCDCIINCGKVTSCDDISVCKRKVNWRSGFECIHIRLLHDNARPHVPHVVRDKLQEYGWEALKYLPYFPDLAPFNFHLFGHMKKFLGCKKFDSEDDQTGRAKVALLAADCILWDGDFRIRLSLGQMP